jgi:Cu/Ag efflux pump CusA
VLRSIVDASIRFRLLVIALGAGIIVGGIALLHGMPVDALPETSPVVVDLQTEALGLSAPEVESLVTVPLEKQLLEGVMGVTDVTSNSVSGLSDIELHFAPGTDLYHARQLVQERLTQSFVLPNVSTPPVMLEPVSSTSDVMLVGLTSSRLDPIDLSVLARWTIVPKLLGLAGVANISTFGQADQQLQVLVEPARLAAQHVTLAQVIATAGNAQLVSPLSYLQGSTPGTGGFLEGPDQRITIQPVLPFGTPANLAELPVTGSKGLRLGSVAQVVRGHPPLIGSGEVRGGPGLLLVVQKLPSASALAVTHEVSQALAELRAGEPGVSFDTSLFREDTYLRSVLGNLRVALIASAALAALALIALLLQFRLAFAAMASAAIALVAATLVLYLLGYTFNALVVLGLLLAVTVVAADAAGDAQRLASRLDTAQPVRGHAAARVVAAATEFRATLSGAALAVLLTVAPLFFATGLTARFLRPAVIAFGLAVIISMVVAVTLTPALASVLVSGSRPAARGTRFRRRVTAGYSRSLDRLAGAPLGVLLAICGALGATALALLPGLHPGQPAFQDRDLVVRWTGPPGMSLTEMGRMTSLASAELRVLPEVQDVAATLGRAVTADQVVNTNSGEIWVTVKPGANYAQALAAVRTIADGTPGITGEVSTYETDSMTGVLTAPPTQVVTRVYGSDYGELARLAGRLRTVVRGIGGVRGTQTRLPVDQPTIDVVVNLDAAARDGITPGDIRRDAGTLLNGLIVGNYFENQAVFEVVVRAAPASRASLSDVDDLLLDTANGGHVRLGDVASISVSPEPADIPHEAMSRYLDVTAQVTGGQAGAVSAAITARLQAMRFPTEYHAEVVTGTSQAGLSPNGDSVAGTSRTEFAGYVIAALVAILLLIQAAAGSWRRAALAFGSLPVSLAGGVFIAYALGATGSLAATAGLVGVFVIAVRQAINVAARLGAPGQGRADAAASAVAGDVLVAAVVTAVAMAPFVVMGDVPGLELLHTTAAVILGGLVTTTLVSLYVLPAGLMRLGPVHAVSSPTGAAGPPGPLDAGGEEGHA